VNFRIWIQTKDDGSAAFMPSWMYPLKLRKKRRNVEKYLEPAIALATTTTTTTTTTAAAGLLAAYVMRIICRANGVF
jgi:hypothetical protein